MRPWRAEPEQGQEAAQPAGASLRDVLARVLYGYVLLTHLLMLSSLPLPPGAGEMLSFVTLLGVAAACVMMLRLPRARWAARRKIAFVLGAYALLRLALLATALLTPERDDTLLIALAIGGSIWVALIAAAVLVHADFRPGR